MSDTQDFFEQAEALGRAYVMQKTAAGAAQAKAVGTSLKDLLGSFNAYALSKQNPMRNAYLLAKNHPIQAASVVGGAYMLGNRNRRPY